MSVLSPVQSHDHEGVRKRFIIIIVIVIVLVLSSVPVGFWRCFVWCRVAHSSAVVSSYD